MKEILLTRGMVAIIDDDDYGRLSQWNWQAVCNKRADGSLYCRAKRTTPSPRKRTVYMHQQILGSSNAIDHINRNALDNRRSNLRWASKSQNAVNTEPRRGSASFKGVKWAVHPSRLRKPWRATIGDTHLGYFESARSAAEAYNTAARRLYGDFAVFNDLEVVA